MTNEAELFEALKYHIEVGPVTGTRRYYNSKDQLHRVDGPAIVRVDGATAWYQNGLRHRIDGPAVIWPDGGSEWWVNGVRHRENGPACVWSDGGSEWWINGKKYTVQNYRAKLAALGLTT